MKYLILLFFFPFLLFSQHSEYVAEQFSNAFQEENFSLCNEILSEWVFEGDLLSEEILALRASILIADGKIHQGKLLLQDALERLPSSPFLDSVKTIIKDLAAQYIGLSFSTECSPNSIIRLCKDKQSKGVKVRYWFGVAQMVAGCIVAPFNPAAGGGLILTGLSTVVHAGADAIDNKEDWERKERERQQMNPKFQHSSFLSHQVHKKRMIAC